MGLGDAIGPAPSKQMAAALEGALTRVLSEQGDSIALVKAALERLEAVAVQQAAIADQQLAATNYLASAAQSLAQRTVMPAPVVNVSVPEAPEVEAPIVNVAAPDVTVNAPVTVMPEQESKHRVRKHVVRDSNGLITDIIEESI